MRELLQFLTSKEIIVVYAITGVACLICFIIYLIEKNNDKLRKKQNTKELNKLVEAIQEEVEIKEEPVILETPVIQKVESSNTASSVIELLESTQELVEVKKEVEVLEEIPEIKELKPTVIKSTIEEVLEEEELQYTSIEPDQETAKLELEKLTEELKKQEEIQEMENIALTNYEEEQEENAIISLEELVKKSKEMYEANELTQYADEGNEPISLQDLERKMGSTASEYNEPFIIANVVPEEEVVEAQEVIEPVVEERKNVTLNDFNNIKTESVVVEPIVKKEPVTNKKFQSSPIISPIYGIEKQTNISNTDLELENTANYDKLDEEIKKTNEFLMTLKELQKKLD